MRFHRYLKAFEPFHDAAVITEQFTAGDLAVARLEPLLSHARDAVLDLVFMREDRMAVLPFLIVDALMLWERETPPIAWPQWTSALPETFLLGLEERLEPWLRSLVLARYDHEEHIRFFQDTEAVRAEYAYARTQGWAGAAPLRDVLTALAPYVYAHRFAAGARVAIRDSQGAAGAAILGREARSIALDAGETDVKIAAARWFALPPWPEIADDERYDLAIGGDLPKAGVAIALQAADAGSNARPVSVAAPLPLMIPLSFDLDDADEVRRFFVEVAAPKAPRTTSIPPFTVTDRSSGRIALVLREDWMRTGDADVDAAKILASRLSAQGFDAVMTAPATLDSSQCDILHVIGSRAAAGLLPRLPALHQRGIPIVFAPLADDPKGDALWGTSVWNGILTNNVDDVALVEYESFLERRSLILNAGVTPGSGDSVLYAAVRELLGASHAVIVSSVEERQLLEERFGYAGPAHLVTAYGENVPVEPVDDLVGSGDYVLAHAPVENRQNLFALLRACRRVDLPLVLVGQVADVTTYQRLLLEADERFIWLAEDRLTPARLAGLYGRARVFADLAWSGNGVARVARALACGCAAAVASSRLASASFGPQVATADPWSISGMSAALQAAWERSGERQTAHLAAVVTDPTSTLIATVAAYLQAQERLRPKGLN